MGLEVVGAPLGCPLATVGARLVGLDDGEAVGAAVGCPWLGLSVGSEVG